jgi:hypothetical protein
LIRIYPYKKSQGGIGGGFEVYSLRVGRFLHLKDGVKSFPLIKNV